MPDLVTRRPREGLGDDRPGRLPAVLRGLARQPVPRRRDGPLRRPPCCGRSTRTTPRSRRTRCGTTTGTAPRSMVDDVLIEGGENGWLYIVPMHRGYDPRGLVTVVARQTDRACRAFDNELLAAVAQPGGINADGLDTRYDVSIENSVAYRDGVVYVANSGGLITGWDISDVLHGGAQRAPGVPVLDGRRHRRVDRDRRRGLPVRRERVPAVRRDVAAARPADEARPSKRDDPVVWSVPALGARVRGRRGELVHARDLRRHACT